MSNKIAISGNISRKIYNATEGSVLRFQNEFEAESVAKRATKLGCKFSRRGCNLLVSRAIDKTKYLWLSGDPVQDNRKPCLKGVE